ncbi:MAG: hypothetical protein BWY52_01643 [Chloroflexi bacterium ADurb.Bin325]|nr:MAG: hypothetical protein BWY52_01643 [Chloroflexi bacterium ADurb.Bin325]
MRDFYAVDEAGKQLLAAEMTGFLAWLLDKAMLETRGFLWSGAIHLVPDVAIFFSYALLFVQG